MRRWLLLLVILYQASAMSQGTPQQELLKQMKSAVIEKIDGRDFYIHTIKRGQTLYMISKAYGVDVNTIITENPFVKDGIRADEKLKIPVPEGQQSPSPVTRPPSSKEKPVPAKEPPAVQKTPPVRKDSAVMADLPCGEDRSTQKEEYRVALMLPLYLDGVDQINTDNPDPAILETNRSFQFLPYYEGFLMALDSVSRSGGRIRLYVYDADKDTAKTRQILRKPEMKSMDLIFGLLYHQNFKIVASFAKKNRINLVNPISERSELVNGNPYVYKIQPSRQSQADQLAAYMAEAFADGQILIVRNGKFKDQGAADRLKKACQERGLSVRLVESQGAAITSYSREKKNYVVAFSDNQTYALEFMREMYKLRNEYDLTLVGLPDWSAMDGLENEYLVALNAHMVSRTFIDYDDPAVKTFVRQYQERYKADPDTLAFQGFDQALYFLTALRRYGTNIGRCLPEMKSDPLGERFNFAHTKENGYDNRYWRIFKYENYRLIPVN